MKFDVPPVLVEKLRRRKPGGDYADVAMREHNAFVLDLGMGPAMYLRLDGQVLIDERWWFGDAVREATDDEAITALVSGSAKTGIAELLDLIPPPPPDARPCSTCKGSRWVTLPILDVHGKEGRYVCRHCAGRGWAG